MCDHTEIALRDILREVLSYPASKVCKHWVGLAILNKMEQLGIHIDRELVQAVGNADDEKIRRLLGV